MVSMSPGSDATVQLAGDGVFYDGAVARRRSVRVTLAEAVEIREGDELLAVWPYADLRRADDPGALRLACVSAPELARLEIGDNGLAKRLIARSAKLDEGLGRPDNLKRIIVGSIAAAVSIAALAIYGVPAIAERLTPLIPQSVEARLGEATAKQVDAIFSGAPCHSASGDAALSHLVEALTAAGDPRPNVEVQVRHSSVPNAFAIPGGHVYLLGALLEKADTPDEIAGVLAHEFGHVAHRDSLRELIASGGAGFLVGLLLGDVSGSGALLFATRAILNSAHSRDAETNADAYAAKTMRALGRSPAPLGEFLLRLTGAQTGGAMALFNSHPLTQDRLAALRAVGAPVTGTPLLTEAEWQALKHICD